MKADCTEVVCAAPTALRFESPLPQRLCAGLSCARAYGAGLRSGLTVYTRKKARGVLQAALRGLQDDGSFVFVEERHIWRAMKRSQAVVGYDQFAME